MTEFTVFYLSDTVTMGFNPTQGMVVCFHIFSFCVVCVVHCRKSPCQEMTLYPRSPAKYLISTFRNNEEEMEVLGFHCSAIKEEEYI
jgi:hypothetical protein